MWLDQARCRPCRARHSRRKTVRARLALLVLSAFLLPVQIPAPAPAAPKDHGESIRALATHLGVGEGAVVADIGAGKGQYTWPLAQVVGPGGTVYAEEISQRLVDSVEEEAEKRALPQVHPVLGRSDDPGLPEGSVDLAFVRYVYHHFAKPREMLREIRRALKPGGHLVVIDRHRGTLRDWVPREQREKKHSWIAETTVVREAREEGFAFVECAESYWHEKDPFVLVFQRPEEPASAGGDPDPFLSLHVQTCAAPFLPLGKPCQRPVFIAMGEARALISPILEHCTGTGLDVVLEEWATQKDERPPLPAGVSLPSTLTESGDPHFGPEPFDAVFFLDTYHLLFHGETLLAKIHERLAPAGIVYVLDRAAQEPLPRRESSHRRRIAPETVRDEMAAAGFSFRFKGPQLAPDRFLLVFGKTPPQEIAPEADPLFGGPTVSQPQAKNPVKVFILAGQSNMEGQGVVDLDHPQYYNGGRGTLERVMRDPGKADRFAHLKDAAGDWTVRDDVWVQFKTNHGLKKGPLTIGFTGYPGRHHIGPELQFGHVIGDAVEEQVLLIKTAWGGKSLYKDFRPPRAGGETGPYYTKMLEEVRDALDHLADDLPAYDGRGYEIAGFVWFQGWNDMFDGEARAEYEQNLVHLIQDVRQAWNRPNLPVVIGELGNGGPDAGPNMLAIRKAQAGAARRPEFEGTVAFVETSGFARPREQSPNVGHGHHWFGNAESYFLIGDALGQAMIGLLQNAPREDDGPGSVTTP